MEQTDAQRIKHVFMRYLEETVYIKDIPKLLSIAQQALNSLVPNKKTEYFIVQDEILAEMIVHNDTVEFSHVQREIEQLRAVLKSGRTLWTKEENTQCWNGAIALISGSLCWGCVILTGVDFEKTPEDREAAEKICGYLAIELLPLLETLNSRAVALELLQKDALIMLSSELKMPLTIATSATQLLRHKLQKHDDALYQAEYLDLFNSLEQNLYKSVRQADNLLEIGRLEAGYARPNPEWFDIEDCVKEIVHSVTPYLYQDSLQISFNSALKKPVEVLSDMQYLSRIVLNLLSNATKSSQKAKGQPMVAVTLALHGTMVAISVRDNGPGIPQEDIPHVFEKFRYSQAQYSSRVQSSGLGLYLSKLLTEKLDARLVVDDMAQGACFTLHLPVQSSVFPAGSALHGQRAEYQSDSWKNRVHIEFADFISSMK